MLPKTMILCKKVILPFEVIRNDKNNKTNKISVYLTMAFALKS